MILLRHIPNIFNPRHRKTIECPHVSGRTIREYVIEHLGIDAEGHRFIVSGRVTEDANECPRNGEDVIITPIIAVPIAVIWTAIKIVATILTIVAASYSIYAAVQARKRAKNFNTSLTSGGAGFDESSPTYGFDGLQNTAEVGRPIPIVYGRHRIAGNIINEYVRSDGDKQYYHALIGLCEGDIESIDDIEIDDNPVENYTGVTVYKRYGTIDQEAVPTFDELHDLHEIDVQLTQGIPYIYTTDNTDIEGFEVHINLPSGLYTQNSETGAVESWSVSVFIEYRVVGVEDWTTAGTYTIEARSRSAVRRIIRVIGITPGMYDIRVTRTSADSDFNSTGDTYWLRTDELRMRKLCYPTLALLGVVSLAQEHLSGSRPNITSLIEARKVRIPDVRYLGNAIDWEDYYWDPTASAYKRFSDDAVCTWDEETYIEAFSANPIWCYRDLMLNTRYGLGEFVESENVPDSYWLEMAQECDQRVDDGDGGYEKKFRLDVVIDGEAAALDVLQQLALTFRGLPFYSEGIVRAHIDREEQISQIFGMGNIVKGSFKQEWKSVKDRPNIVEVQYLDQDKGYKNEILHVMDQSAREAGEPRRIRSVRLFVTKASYAIREATFILNRERNVDRSFSFRTAIEAVVCQAGDVIGISHDVPQWGSSGRIVAGSTTTSINLDQEITIEAATTYSLMIRFSDDTIEERTVTNSPGVTDIITVSSAFSQTPAAFDVYSIGQETILVKPARIIQIERARDGEVEISAQEYVEDIYTASSIVVPTDNYSTLENSAPDVNDLTLTEGIVLLNDGTIDNVIDVWWRNPDTAGKHVRVFDRVRVFLSDDAGASWQLRAETRGAYVRLQGDLVTGQTYSVAVVSVSDRNEQNIIDDSPSETITVLGKTAKPSTPANFDIAQQGSFLFASWDGIPDVDLARYVIKKGSDWDTASLIAELVDTTEFSFPVGQIGEQTYLIKAVDTSGNESETPAVDTITVTTPPDLEFVNTLDLWATDLTFEHSNTDLVWDTLYDRHYTRPTLALRTAKTWKELEAEGYTWKEQEAAGGLLFDETYETTGVFTQKVPFDLGLMFSFKVVSDAVFETPGGGSVSFKISTSEDGTTYTSFEAVSSTTIFRGRYIKFEITITTSDAALINRLVEAQFFITAPGIKKDWGTDQAVPATGLTINFAPDFEFKPRFHFMITNGIKGWVDVDELDEDHAKVYVRDISTDAALATAEGSFSAEGY